MNKVAQYYRELVASLSERLRNGERDIDALVEQARERVIKTGELTRTEVDELTRAVRRDLEEFAMSYEESLKEESDSVFMRVIKESLWQELADITDKSQRYLAAEIIREKGTNRSKFYRGQIDKYTWVNYGSSYLPSDMNAAYLYAQLEKADEINEARLALWNRYYQNLLPLAESGRLELPVVPEGCVHNAHMFYVKAKDITERTAFIDYLKENGIMSVFHYIPLHTAPAGKRFGRFHGEDRYTTRESERLARLPMYYGLKETQVDDICQVIKRFYA